MTHFHHRVAVGALLIVWLGGCEMLGSDSSDYTHSPDPEQAQILFIAAGGFSGGVRDSLTITADGLATNRNVIPHLQKQLSKRKHEQIVGLFDGFFRLPEPDDEIPCADDIGYEISYRNGERTRTMSVWGCTLHHSDGQLAQRLSTIIDTMRALADRIYQQKAPWIGVDVAYSIDRDTYAPRDLLTIRYRITNPTQRRRTLYFPYEHRTGFRVYGREGTDFSYRFPPGRYERREDGPTTLTIPPGDTRLIERTWDLTVPDGAGERQAIGPGTYALIPALLDSGHHGLDSAEQPPPIFTVTRE